MFKPLIPILLIALAAPTVASAQDTSDWRFGGDAYVAGRSVTVTGDAVEDLFAAGDKVTARSDVNGSAHMAGRYVTLQGRVGENFYGAGMEVEVDGVVAGNVTIMGESLSVTEPVAGNLRAAGSDVEISAPVAGNAVIGGEHVTINEAIVGDLALGAANVTWGERAVVEGRLHVYTDDPDEVDVPERVASADRIEVHEAGDFEEIEGMPAFERPSFLSQLRGWLGSIVVVGLLGTALAALAPDFVASLREKALARPARTGALGFVGLSALAGSVVFLALTGFGIILAPLSIIATVLLAVAGYVLGTYIVGVWATGLAGRATPETTTDRAIAAFAGAAVGAVLGLVPFLGWLGVMVIFLVGAGAFVVKWLAPAFRVEDAA